MNYGYPTSLRFSRTMRKTGTEYANAIERHKSMDTSGITIILICGVGIAMLVIGLWK